uniref:Si:ch211-244b2.4 n=1 Tax=Erpetoichthys calabaricus TaxID=27687 RepID=A0A8C4RYA7_ERPCA
MAARYYDSDDNSVPDDSGYWTNSAGCDNEEELNDTENSDLSESDGDDTASSESDDENKVQQPCKFYNNGDCREGKKCKFLHVCKYDFKGRCKRGSMCVLKHRRPSGQSSDSSEDESRGSRSSSEPRRTKDKPYQWQINSGDGWKNIENDFVIEAQYSLPNSKGIKLYNTPYGVVNIDFNKMRVNKRNLRIRRKTFEDCTLKPMWVWYCRSNRRWILFEEKNSKSTSNSSAPCSDDIENHYQQRSRGRLLFTIGQNQYELNFREMKQINLTSGHKRKIVRRPKFIACKNKSGKDSKPRPSSARQQFTVPSGGSTPLWQFQGDSGKWYDFKHRAGTETESSISSKDIEAKYQMHPSGSMTFRVGRQQYSLSFSD